MQEKIRELEQENAELKERNAELKGMYAHSAREAGTYKQFLELKEKENAELKTKLTALENANRAMVKELNDTTSGGLCVLENVVRSKEQLTKAKEIIREFLQHYNAKTIYVENMNDLLTEAEQFISEVEK